MLLRRYLPVAALFVLCAMATALRAEGTVAQIAQIKLSGDLDETPTALDPILGIQPENFKIKLERLLNAKKDDKVKAVLLHIDGLDVGLGKVNELRKAIQDVRSSGKKVYAFLESGDLAGGGTADYAVAAACDEIALPEVGSLALTGLRFELSFYKDLFDKLGLKADMLQMGDFKGAGETFTRNSMSKENRAQWEALADDFYAYMVDSIAESRRHKGLTPDKVKQLIDEGPYTARKALQAGLIDRLAYADAYPDRIKEDLKAEKVTVEKNYGKKKSADIDFANPFAIFKLLAPPKEAKLSAKPKVAVIYAVGPITTGKGGQSLFGGSVVGSTTLVEAIKKAEEEPTVKAIVLRVDSPGGSALASDLIWNELQKSKKPVVASMSDVAASGGYYISMAAKKIYAEPATITGSIGVVGGKIVLGGLFDKVGVKTEIVARGANSGIFSSETPFTDSERKVWKDMMQDIYDQFVDKATAGRRRAGKDLSREHVLKHAGGRIWSGKRAKEIGLIDELGTLDDAVAAAREMAGLSKDEDVELLILPKARSFLDTLLEASSETSLSRHLAQSALPMQLLPELGRRLRYAEALLQLRNERVWLILPHGFEVR